MTTPAVTNLSQKPLLATHGGSTVAYLMTRPELDSMHCSTNTNSVCMYSTLAFRVVLSLSPGLLPAVSLLTSLCIASTPEASADTVAKPTTQPAWPLSSQQQTPVHICATAYVLEHASAFCMWVLSEYYVIFPNNFTLFCWEMIIIENILFW